MASADVLLDQIGPDDGSGLGANIMASQIFEAAYAQYSVVVADDMTLTSIQEITGVEAVVGGWNGWVDPSGITAYSVNLYSSNDAAGADLMGDIAHQMVDAADAEISGTWAGANYLINVPVAMYSAAGTQLVGIAPANEFATSGQCGIAQSLLGDGNCIQANPGGGFGFGPWQAADDACYRVNGAAGDPCGAPLAEPCPTDINGDGAVNVTDLLTVIGDWGNTGDGTYRPEGDCAPLPNGDCTTNVADVLAVISSWGADCATYGACCYSDGTCDDGSTASGCADAGGTYLGDNSSCADGGCTAAACCIGADCVFVTEDACGGLGGVWHDGDDCTSWDCSAATPGDECADAIAVYDGANSFDTSSMTASQPQPDETQCEGTYLDWDESPDGWYMYTATATASCLFDACDAASYDTSMVLYSDCGTQLACNGDSANQSGCQTYYSEITYDVVEGNTYIIRMGGWQGGSGAGTINITLDIALAGACCLDEVTCLDDLDSNQCDAFGGTFQGEGTVCDSVDCDPELGGDECADASVANIGPNAFDTSFATPSQPQPDETQCEGTFLEWMNSNDVWFVYTPDSSGNATFTTCDAASYDTSMVLYEGDCDTQVACNGDSSGDSGCQAYYSKIEYAVTAGTPYYVRLGGWQAAYGAGTLTIEQIGGDETAACCVMGDCIGEVTSADCSAAGGTWYYGETCADVACPQPACPGSQVSQNVHGSDESWTAGTAANDPTGGATYERAESINVDSMTHVRFWGIEAFFDGAGWGSAPGDWPMNVRAYDASMTMTDEIAGVMPTEAATGELYAGAYELIQYDIDASFGAVANLGIQSESDGMNSWFLWMSSGIGDGDSMMNDGTGWVSGQGFDLSICID